MHRLVETAEGIVEEDGSRAGDWNPNYVGDRFHIEEYDGDVANVHGRVRLEPTSTAALQREIKQSTPDSFDLPHRSAAGRLARARRMVQSQMRSA